MYPVVFDTTRVRVVLIGDGEAAENRLDGLDGTAAGDVSVFSPTPSIGLAEKAGRRLQRRLPDPSDLAGAHLVLIAGLDEETSAGLAAAARALAIPVNVEDRPALCDFHVPAVVRRGELLLTVSTAGTAPALAARIRRWLEQAFGPEWAERVARFAAERGKWRAEGAEGGELRRRAREWIDRQGWFG